MQVRLAKEARELAVVAMQKEPQDDLAQHLMGRQAAPAPCPSMPTRITICEHMMTLQQRSFHSLNLYQDSSTYFG